MVQFIHRILRLNTITSRLLFWVIAFIIICNSLHVVTFMLIDRGTRMGAAEANLSYAMRNQQVILENWAVERAREIRYLAQLPAVRELDLDGMAEVFMNDVAIHDELEAIVYLDQLGRVRLDTAASNIFVNTQTRLDNRNYFIAARQGMEELQEIFYPSTTREPVMIFSVPLRSAEEAFQGLIFGAVHLSRVNELLFTSIQGESGQIILVNREGRILSYLSRREQSGHMLSQTLETDIISGGLGEISFLSYVNHYNEAVFGSMKPVLDGRYFLINEIGAEEIMRPHLAIVRIKLIIALSIAVISVLLVFMLSRFLMRPFLHTMNAIERIKAGQYRSQLDPRQFQTAPAEIQHMAEVFNEMTATIYNHHQALEQLSNTDGLTGLCNRRRFEQLFEREWLHARESKRPLSLAIIDIDCFKEFNDTYGHQAGDDGLRMVSQTMKVKLQLQRPRDLIARYGGEEFVIVLPGASIQETWEISEELRLAVEALCIPHARNPASPYITVSIGVASQLPAEGGEKDALLANADQALYKAKSSGRNQVAAHSNRQ